MGISLTLVTFLHCSNHPCPALPCPVLSLRTIMPFPCPEELPWTAEEEEEKEEQEGLSWAGWPGPGWSSPLPDPAAGQAGWSASVSSSLLVSSPLYTSLRSSPVVSSCLVRE